MENSREQIREYFGVGEDEFMQFWNSLLYMEICYYRAVDLTTGALPTWSVRIRVTQEGHWLFGETGTAFYVQIGAYDVLFDNGQVSRVPKNCAEVVD